MPDRSLSSAQLAEEVDVQVDLSRYLEFWFALRQAIEAGTVGEDLPWLPDLGDEALWRLVKWEVADSEKPLVDLVAGCLREWGGRQLPYSLIPGIYAAADLTGTGYGVVSARCVNVGPVETHDWTRLADAPDGARMFSVVVSSTVAVGLSLLARPTWPEGWRPPDHAVYRHRVAHTVDVTLVADVTLRVAGDDVDVVHKTLRVWG